MKIKKSAGLTVAGLAALCLANPVQASSVEIVAQDKSTTLDLKMSSEIAPHLTFFTRQRITANYDGNKVGHFGTAMLWYRWGAGLSGVVEAQASPATGVMPHVGLLYANKFGDLQVIGMGTAGWQEEIHGRVQGFLNYRPELSEDLGLILDVENMTKFGDKHRFSVQRARVGLQLYDKYGVGFALDLVEVGPKVVARDVKYLLGGFVRAGF